MKTKKKWFLFAAIIFSIGSMAFSSCSSNDNDENQISIKNLSGVDWYDTSVVFKETMEADSKIIKIISVGDVPVGSSCSVNNEGMFLYISAKNNRGKIFMSRIQITSNKITISSNDILINI